MPSTTRGSGSLGRQAAFALAAAAVAAVGAVHGLVPMLIDLSTDTLWLVSGAGASSCARDATDRAGDASYSAAGPN
ncbi:hypothetical protein [Halobaculum sp. EA56]|uniref:hypothetical protein n=1 Tax=Halobaculum sp. EA56 TaxID=3421648 RepID=UPI003EBF127F